MEKRALLDRAVVIFNGFLGGKIEEKNLREELGEPIREIWGWSGNETGDVNWKCFLQLQQKSCDSPYDSLIYMLIERLLIEDSVLTENVEDGCGAIIQEDKIINPLYGIEARLLYFTSEEYKHEYVKAYIDFKSELLQGSSFLVL